MSRFSLSVTLLISFFEYPLLVWKVRLQSGPRMLQHQQRLSMFSSCPFRWYRESEKSTTKARFQLKALFKKRNDIDSLRSVFVMMIVMLKVMHLFLQFMFKYRVRRWMLMAGIQPWIRRWSCWGEWHRWRCRRMVMNWISWMCWRSNRVMRRWEAWR